MTSRSIDLTARLWVFVAAVVGVSFALLTPPFQVPDEVAHYRRAYAIGIGQFSPRIEKHRTWVSVPAGVEDLVVALNVQTAGHPEVKVGWDRIRDAAGLQLRRETRVSVGVIASYTPVPYLPAAMACALGNAFGLRPLVSFYLGRLFNVAALMALMEASRRRLKWAFPVNAVCLLPMTLFLAGSYSSDTVTIGIALYVIALLLSPEENVRYWRRLSVAAFLLACCKPVYLFLPLLALVRQSGRDRSVQLLRGVLVLAIVAGACWSTATVRRNYVSVRRDVVTDPGRQLANVARNPLRFVRIAVGDFVASGSVYREEMVGRLGWLDLFLAPPLVSGTLLLLLALMIASPFNPGIPSRVAAAFAFAGALFAISLSLYVAWSAVGGASIDGIQGRYFLPLVPLAAVIAGVPKISSRIQTVTLVLFTAMVLTIDCTALHAIVRRYY